MKWITKLVLSLSSCITCLIIVVYISPLKEMYTGATGYIYQNGLFFNILYYVFFILGILSLGYFLVECTLNIKEG